MLPHKSIYTVAQRCGHKERGELRAKEGKESEDSQSGISLQFGIVSVLSLNDHVFLIRFQMDVAKSWGDNGLV